jgi:hypothetical protein
VYRPSDTIPEYTRSCGDVYSSVLVVGEVDAELVVDGSFVFGVGVGEGADDVLELAYEGFDLVLCVLAGGWFAAEVAFDVPAFAFTSAIQAAALVISLLTSRSSR